MQEKTTETTASVPHTERSGVVIANPTAGSFTQNRHLLEETLERLRARGWQVELELTDGPDAARKLARDAVKQGRDAVIAVGGDGTINEIVQELAGSQTALGVLPSGTVNVWAREVGIPFDYAGASAVLLEGQTRSIDLGKVNDRYFLLMAGIGIDGEVTEAVEKRGLKRFGVLGYVFAGVGLFLGYPGFPARITMGGQVTRVRAMQIMIGNTQLYGGAIKVTWQARCDDGLLDVCIVRTRSILARVAMSLDFLLHHKRRQQWVRYETCETIRVFTSRRIPIQTDGDPAGYTPATFSVAPNALKVIVPANAPASLFSKTLEAVVEG